MGCTVGKTGKTSKVIKHPAPKTPASKTNTKTVDIVEITPQTTIETPKKASRESTSTTKEKTSEVSSPVASKNPPPALSSVTTGGQSSVIDGKTHESSMPKQCEMKALNKPSVKSHRSSKRQRAKSVKKVKSVKSKRNQKQSKTSHRSQRSKKSGKDQPQPRSPVSQSPGHKDEDDRAKTPAMLTGERLTVPDEKVRLLGELDKAVLLRRAEIHREIEEMDSIHEHDKTSGETAVAPIDHDKHVKIVEEKCGVYLIAPDDQELIAQVDAAAL